MAEPAPKDEKAKAEATWWLRQFEVARRRESKFRKRGAHIQRIYANEAEDGEDVAPFNILFSNTETLAPALFSQAPRSSIERRNRDDDPIGKLASTAANRVVDFQFDTNREGYESIVEVGNAVVLDALLPGRGVAVVKYEAEFKPLAEPRPPDDEERGASTAKAKSEEEPPAEYATNEQICYESIVWDRVLFGFAKKWKDVPWIAYEFFMTKRQVEKLLGEKVAEKLQYSLSNQSVEKDDERSRDRKEDHVGGDPTAQIYQIWDKAGGRKIRYLSPTYVDGMLAELDDPLNLSGFYNTPKPLQLVGKSWSLVPTAPYRLYQSQAEELNDITRRIKKLTQALKVRALYDGSMSGNLAQLFAQPENAMVPVDVASALATEKGFTNAIWFFPIDVVMQVLRELQLAREACKQTIYEITGISDILRGATQASETATAQQLKSQWGTLRLKKNQAEVARYMRDLQRLTVELAANKFSEETWAEMTGLPLVTSARRQQLEAQARMVQMMMIESTAGNPQVLLNPQLLQQQQQLKAELQKPVWGDILQLLKHDAQRVYKIDIETNSTIEPEAAEDQKAIADLLGAVTQTLQGLGPLVVQGVMPFQAAQGLLLFVCRRFRFGSQIEDAILAMQPPKPPEEGKAQAEQKQVEMQKQQAMQEVEQKKSEASAALKEQGMQQEMAHKQREMDLQLREKEIKLLEKQLQIEAEKLKMQLDAQRQQTELHAKGASAELGLQQKTVELEQKKYNTERVVNSKADSALGQGMKGIEAIVNKLAALIEAQAKGQQQLMAALAKDEKDD